MCETLRHEGSPEAAIRMCLAHHNRYGSCRCHSGVKLAVQLLYSLRDIQADLCQSVLSLVPHFDLIDPTSVPSFQPQASSLKASSLGLIFVLSLTDV
jgi:hypothetical protein